MSWSSKQSRSRTKIPVTNQLETTLARLTRLHPKLIDLSLGRIERLLTRLGHPEQNLPPVVHVAGTNGKGSAIAFLRAMLCAAGYRVHVYTSPHLIDFNERIVLDGHPIDDAALVALLKACEAANGETPITFFEITTAAAMLAFARAPADILLLETGLGGRLDATNVVAQPRLCAITPISLDHQHFLGDTLREIAAEKAAILKPGVPAVIGKQAPGAAQVVEARSIEVDAPLIISDRDWSTETTAAGFIYMSGPRHLSLPEPALAGTHQIDNAAMAIACAENLAGFTVTEAAIAEGLRTAKWPGRLQRLDATCFTNRSTPDVELWLDGGHNPAAANALATCLRSWTDRPLHLVVGMMNGKDPRAFLEPLAPHVAALWAVPIPGETGAHAPGVIADAACALGLPAQTRDSVAAALDVIPAGSPSQRVLICGSLYLAGQVLAQQRYALSA